MTFVTWPILLSFIFFIFFEGVLLHRATICRQNTWLAAAELLTQELVDRKLPFEYRFKTDCGYVLAKQGHMIFWKIPPNYKVNRLELHLRGKL